MVKHIDRRTMLRGMFGGAAMGLGLPILESMLNTSGTAFASGAALPVRYGTWFWGTGINPANWIPANQGTGYTLSPHLQPLASMQNKFSVVTNTSVPFPGGFFHWTGQGQILSGSYDGSGAPFGLPGAISFDQIVANAWAGKTAIPSLQVGIAQQAFGSLDVPDVSWLGDKQPNTVEFSPANFYNSLFGAYHKNLSLSVSRRSVLDLVQNDMNDLRARVGKSDALRLDQHAQNLREIETSLTAFITNLCTPPAPVTDPGPDGNAEPLVERNKLFSDMMALALSCDLTRVFSVQFTGVASNVTFTQVGATGGHHTLSHNGSAAAQTMFNNGVLFTMQQLAYFVQKLSATPEGSGSLLDNMVMFGTSDIGDGSTNGATHTQAETPILLIGSAGGALKPGQHYRPASTMNTQSALITVARALNLPMKQFGQATTAFTPLLA